MQDLVLKNAQPVVFEGTTKSIDIRSANFVAKDTTLTASGRLALDSKNPWDVAVKGNINLSILQIFNPDLLASGTSVVNMTVRGSLTEPQVDGRVELQNASLFIRDLPNGVDQANGLILFDRNRATIQNLTGVTGGGNVTFESGSFVGFRGTALIYRLQATAKQVRYRSPDGVSITVNATLSLIGTSENSVLSGNVVVVRAGFNPRTDVGSLLASTARPVSFRPRPTSICVESSSMFASTSAREPRSGDLAHPQHPGRRQPALARHAGAPRCARQRNRELRRDRVLREQVHHQPRRHEFLQSGQD